MEVLQPASCALLETVAATCGHDSLPDLGAELVAALEDDVQTARSSFLNRTQQCFAVRAGVHGLLDVARATYCRVSEAVQELAERYCEQYRLPHLKVWGMVDRRAGGRAGGWAAQACLPGSRLFSPAGQIKNLADGV